MCAGCLCGGLGGRAGFQAACLNCFPIPQMGKLNPSELGLQSPGPALCCTWVEVGQWGWEPGLEPSKQSPWPLSLRPRLKGAAGPKCQCGAVGWCPEGLVLQLVAMWLAGTTIVNVGKESSEPAETQGSNFPFYEPAKGVTEDEMLGWHHQLNGHEFEQTLGVGDGQGSLACCSPWGCKESDMT